ncbi:MAG: hypothetical protein OJF51_004179 [Nitrospira sp.]|jgi:hypothetical protein|nr:MAG: hypothetical protein OJF51_004179 [Nitrospira sp.]
MQLAALIFTICWTTWASASEFDVPRKDQTVALVIDPFYANTIDWTKLAAEQRVVAIIRKATIGTNWKPRESIPATRSAERSRFSVVISRLVTLGSRGRS